MQDRQGLGSGTGRNQIAYLVVVVRPTDKRLIGHIRRIAAEKKIAWSTIVAADAGGPDGPRWSNLTRLVRDAIDALRDDLLGDHHALLVHPGLLGRYDQLAVLDELRERTRRPSGDQRLHALWVLVPSDDPTVAPTIAGRAVPVTTFAEHMELPLPWLENLHQTRSTPVGDTP